MKLHDRLKLTEDYLMTNGIKLKKGYIGTCKEINEEKKEYTLQLAIPIRNQLTPYISISVTLTDLILDNVTQDELKNYLDEYGYEYITSKIFHVNNIWSIKTGYDQNNNPQFRSGLIIDYQVELNEDDDILILKFFDNEEIKSYKKRYVDQFGSYSLIID